MNTEIKPKNFIVVDMDKGAVVVEPQEQTDTTEQSEEVNAPAEKEVSENE